MPRKSTTSTSITSTKIYNIIQRRMYRRRKAGIINREQQKEFYKNLRQLYESVENKVPFTNPQANGLYSLAEWTASPQGSVYWSNWNRILFPELYTSKGKQ